MIKHQSKIEKLIAVLCSKGAEFIQGSEPCKIYPKESMRKFYPPPATISNAIRREYLSPTTPAPIKSKLRWDKQNPVLRNDYFLSKA